MGPTSTVHSPDTNNATWFKFSEVEGEWQAPSQWNHPSSKSQNSEKGAYYQHLAEINRGRKRGRDWWNDRYFRYQTNRDLAEQIAQSMELLQREQNRVKRWASTLDLQRFGMKKELVICCLCAYVMDTDSKDERRAHPNASDSDKSHTVPELSDMFGFREDEIESMYGKVAHRIREVKSPNAEELDRYSMDRIPENELEYPDSINSSSK